MLEVCGVTRCRRRISLCLHLIIKAHFILYVICLQLHVYHTGCTSRCNGLQRVRRIRQHVLPIYFFWKKMGGMGVQFLWTLQYKTNQVVWLLVCNHRHAFTHNCMHRMNRIHPIHAIAHMTTHLLHLLSSSRVFRSVSLEVELEFVLYCFVFAFDFCLCLFFFLFGLFVLFVVAVDFFFAGWRLSKGFAHIYPGVLLLSFFLLIFNMNPHRQEFASKTVRIIPSTCRGALHMFGPSTLSHFTHLKCLHRKRS